MFPSVSCKIGGLPLLSRIFDAGPLTAALVMIIADFGIICLLMCGEGLPPWKRGLYLTFKWNDTIFIPLYLAAATHILQQPSVAPLQGFYTKAWWHIMLLVASFSTSFLMEIGALRSGEYTLSQELSPSKLWHTFIFGIVGYWMSAVLIPLCVVHAHGLATLCAIVGVLGFFSMTVLHAILPFPKDAHLEGSWIPWRWSVRKY